MSDWTTLHRELDAWHAQGRRATLWCRDDDATRDTPALRRLLAVAERHRVPLALATIPALLDPSLLSVLRECPIATVVQHGYAHRNHAPASERSCELGAHRPLQACLAELARGRETLAEAFGERFVSVLVPPWNRIDDSVVAALPDGGLHGLSTFAPRTTARPVAGVLQCNTHVDVISWRSGRTFVGEARALARLVEHLQARRSGDADPGEATGLLTHHLDLGDDAWCFIDALFARTHGHPAADWLDVAQIFGPSPVKARAGPPAT